MITAHLFISRLQHKYSPCKLRIDFIHSLQTGHGIDSNLHYSFHSFPLLKKLTISSSSALKRKSNTKQREVFKGIFFGLPGFYTRTESIVFLNSFKGLICEFKTESFCCCDHPVLAGGDQSDTADNSCCLSIREVRTL